MRRNAVRVNGKELAIAYVDGSVFLWDTTRQTLVGAPFVPPGGLSDVGLWITARLAFSPDGRYLSEVLPYGDSPGLGMVWDVASGQSAPLTYAANGLAVSADIRLVAEAVLGDPTYPIRLWNLSTGQSTGALMGDAAEVQSVAFSPDGRTLASVDSSGTTILWSLATRRPVASLLAPPSPFSSYFTGSLDNPSYNIGFSRDGQRLLVADGRTIALWDVASRQLYMRPIVDPGTFRSATLSPDGQLLVESELVGPVIVRYATVAGWQAQACQIANRNLTAAEWAQFLGTAKVPYRTTCPNLPAN